MSNQTSENLRLNIPRILTEWEEQVHKSILSARGLTSLVLKGDIQSFLESIADALSTTLEKTDERMAQNTATILNFAKVHGGGRATAPLHNTLAEVMREFYILHGVVLSVLEEQASVPIHDRKIIQESVYQALSAAVTQFAELHKQIQEQFVMTLVHDLRNPMNVVKMSAQIIKKSSTDSPQTLHMAAMIDKNMGILDSMLSELVNNLRVSPHSTKDALIL